MATVIDLSCREALKETIMRLQLTDEQRQAVEAQPDTPVQLVDEKTNQTYVLMRTDLYEHFKALSEKQFDISETYPAQIESAMRAGWADPAMDDYSNYDENRKKLCP
jgi:hypothetical protein